MWKGLTLREVGKISLIYVKGNDGEKLYAYAYLPCGALH